VDSTKTQTSVTKWRIIFYPHLHPKEPRCLAEAQFTNKRICIFTKHKRYNKYTIFLTVIRETLHIIFDAIFKKHSAFDDIMDMFDYKLSKAINKKRIIKEKGIRYFQTCKHPLQLGVRPHD
jgi:hypothetical protein